MDKYTEAIKFNPDGSQVQRVGIKIDVPVNLTVQGIREGRDEYLETAFNRITLSAEKETLISHPVLTVYPNPVTEHLSINFKNGKPGQRLIIHNILRQTVEEGFLFQDNESIDISRLPDGLYFIRLATENGWVSG